MGIKRHRRPEDLHASIRMSEAMNRLRNRGVPVKTIADMYNMSRQAVSLRLSKYRKLVLKEGEHPKLPAADRAILWRQRLDQPDLHCRNFCDSLRTRMARKLRKALAACRLTQADVGARLDPFSKGRRHATWVSNTFNAKSDPRLSSLGRIAWAMGYNLEINLVPATDKRSTSSPVAEGELPAPAPPHPPTNINYTETIKMLLADAHKPVNKNGG